MSTRTDKPAVCYETGRDKAFLVGKKEELSEFADSILRLLLRAAEAIKHPKIAPDICPNSRRGRGRIAALCNPCRNAEAGQEDTQDGMLYCFRGP